MDPRSRATEAATVESCKGDILLYLSKTVGTAVLSSCQRALHDCYLALGSIEAATAIINAISAAIDSLNINTLVHSVRSYTIPFLEVEKQTSLGDPKDPDRH